MVQVAWRWPGSLYSQKNNSQRTLAPMSVSKNFSLVEMFENGEKKVPGIQLQRSMLIGKTEIEASRIKVEYQKKLTEKAQPIFLSVSELSVIRNCLIKNFIWAPLQMTTNGKQNFLKICSVYVISSPYTETEISEFSEVTEKIFSRKVNNVYLF